MCTKIERWSVSGFYQICKKKIWFWYKTNISSIE